MELATQLCLQRGITIQSNHIAGINNTTTDYYNNIQSKRRRSVCRQFLFLEWCIEKQISQQFFTATDLISFLSDMHTNHLYVISFRLWEDKRIYSLITTLLRQALPSRTPLELDFTNMLIASTDNHEENSSTEVFFFGVMEDNMDFT